MTAYRDRMNAGAYEPKQPSGKATDPSTKKVTPTTTQKRGYTRSGKDSMSDQTPKQQAAKVKTSIAAMKNTSHQATPTTPKQAPPPTTSNY